jgi:hypothetical protein
MLAAGLTVLALGAVTGIVAGGDQFEPIRQFSVMINLRAGILALTLAALMVQRVCLARRGQEYPWISYAVFVFDFAIVVLGFELLTVETLDYFSRISPNITTWLGLETRSALPLTLAVLWAAYSLLIAREGLRRSRPVLIASGLGILALSIGSVAIYGSGFHPVTSFALFLNARAGAFAFVVIMLLAHQRLLARCTGEYAQMRLGVQIFHVVISLLIFELLTAETWDCFSKSIYLAQASARIRHLTESRNMMLSVVWVTYSILLMIRGIWQRLASLRYLAMAVFIITILKVFLLDLSFLETVYRIFSFIALGLVLLATSYLYQRYKGIIVGTADG